MTDVTHGLSSYNEIQRRLPPGWSIKAWRAENDVSLDVQLRHDATHTEFSIRCREMPDWEWLTSELRLAEHVQTGVEISVAHDRWWF